MLNQTKSILSPQLNSDNHRLVRLPEVLGALSISKSTLYLKIKKQEFPAPVKLGQRISVWKSRDVIEYIESLEDKRASLKDLE